MNFVPHLLGMIRACTANMLHFLLMQSSFPLHNARNWSAPAGPETNLLYRVHTEFGPLQLEKFPVCRVGIEFGRVRSDKYQYRIGCTHSVQLRVDKTLVRIPYRTPSRVLKQTVPQHIPHKCIGRLKPGMFPDHKPRSSLRHDRFQQGKGMWAPWSEKMSEMQLGPVLVTALRL